MLRQFAPIQGTIYHSKADLQTFGFGELENPSRVLPDQIHYQNAKNDDPNLCLVSALKTDGSYLLCCGPIDSSLRAQEFNALLDHLFTDVSENRNSTTLRIAIFQFPGKESDLTFTRLLSHLLTKFPYSSEGKNIPQFNLPADPLFYAKKNKPLPVAISTGFNQLSRLYNIEGWLTYNHWILDRLTGIILSIALTDISKFTLEGALEDFSHEVRSIFLETCLQQLQALSLTLGNLEFSKSELVEPPSNALIYEMTKKATELRSELESYLRTQTSLLDTIANIIDEMHPEQSEFLSLKATARVFKELLDTQNNLSGTAKSSFGKQLLLITLLNSLLGVTAVISHADLKQSGLILAISLSVQQLLQTESLPDILKLVLDWDAAVPITNLWLIEKGQGAFVDWLNNPPKEGDESYQPSRLITKLRLYVYENINTFIYPLLSDIGKENVSGQPEIKELAMSKEFLNFLPDHYIDYDATTGQPIGIKIDEMTAIVNLFVI